MRAAVAWLALLLAAAPLGVGAQPGPPLGRTVEPGPTGWAVKRPVLAAACPHSCPFGELGDFLREAMTPLGYDVILCRNCNGAEGPRVVARHATPPPLTAQDLAMGTDERVDAPADFGITLVGVLNSAYRGADAYAKDGPYANLRLIARIEDPTYLLVAATRQSGVTDLTQIRDRRLPARILASGPLARQVLAHYGLTPEVMAAQGGSIGPATNAPRDAAFDVLIGDLASPANNLESNAWTIFSQSRDLVFLDLPSPLLEQLAEPGIERITAKWGLVRGVDRIIPTVGRSGEAVFARADTPDQAAYDIARAIDTHRGELKWFVRPYSYDPRTVWSGLDVPLHPGAARWYREQGYLPR